MSVRTDNLPENALLELVSAFGLDYAERSELEAFENFVFSFGDKILRVSHRSHRARFQIEAEVEWTDYLCSQGLEVAVALPSPGGKRVIETADGEFFGVLLPLFKGHEVVWTPELFRLWGQTVGRLHRVTQSFQPSGPRRHNWNEDRYLVEWALYAGSSFPHLLEPWRRTLQAISELPRDSSSYGLIHADLHSKNFVIQGESLRFFDTDDSHYNWFVYGLASIFLSVAHSPICRSDPMEYVRDFARHFWSGYTLENRLDREQVLQLPVFLKLRQFLLLGAVVHKWDVSKLRGEKLQLVERFRRDAESEDPPLGMGAGDWVELVRC